MAVEQKQSGPLASGPSSRPEFTGDDFRQQFLDLLNNRAKYSKSGNEITRTDGFVALIRGANQLAAVESWCTTEQSYNTCLTVRYRVSAERAIGTLLAGFVSDIGGLLLGREPRGRFNPPHTDERWQRILSDEVLSPLKDNYPVGSGVYSESTLSEMGIRHLIESTELLKKGERLVILCEVVQEEPHGVDEWNAGVFALADLPERVGIVFGDVPDGFELPGSLPQFMEFRIGDGQDTPREAQEVSEFIEGSLVSDRPSTNDVFGLRRYAEAFARFILHPQTKAPLTTLAFMAPGGRANRHL